MCEARTHTAHSLRYAPHKFPRLTGLSDDFSHARAAATATSTIRNAQQIPPQLLGTANEVFSAAAPTSAAAHAIDPLIAAAVPPGGDSRETQAHTEMVGTEVLPPTKK